MENEWLCFLREPFEDLLDRWTILLDRASVSSALSYIFSHVIGFTLPSSTTGGLPTSLSLFHHNPRDGFKMNDFPAQDLVDSGKP